MRQILIILVLILSLLFSTVLSEDDKAKKYEEFKKKVMEKFKDAELHSLIEASEKLEEYYKFKSAAAYRDVAITKLEKQKKQLDESLSKIMEQKTAEEINENLKKFLTIAENRLNYRKTLLDSMLDRCQFWRDENLKGKENSLIYVKIERKFILSREKDIRKYYVEIEKYDAKGEFSKARQKRILLKNRLSRQNIFIDGKIKAYESTLKSIKRRKKLKNTTVQKKAELRIKYYEWAKKYSEKIVEVRKSRVDAEMKHKYHEDLTFFYENLGNYSKIIAYPEYLKLKDVDIAKIIKTSQKLAAYLKKRNKKSRSG
ncbi:MAG: hypothetical protein K8S87_10790 [Planctomycetes bacterium]|nr:hypothetical protein [Planctomycetota bacterium]